jgi:prevent-host-death family protein
MKLSARPSPALPRSRRTGRRTEAAGEAPPGEIRVNVRAAKDQLSRLLDQAAQGTSVVITSDGAPRARLVAFRRERRAFEVDWPLLNSQPVSGGPSATELVRTERDGRA